MRILLIAIAMFLALAPSGARAADKTFNCYCAKTLGETCNFAQTVQGADSSKATPPCISVCEARGNEMCKLQEANSDKTTGPCAGRTVCLTNPLNTASVPELIANILKTVVGTVGAFALLIFVYGGFLWLTSAGDAGKVQQGKDAMKWALIGLVIVFSSYTLVSFVLSALTKV